MINWDTNFYIGDRVQVAVAHTTRHPRTHRIVVEHLTQKGVITTIDLDGEDLGIRFDDGRVRAVRNRDVQKIESVVGLLT
ncbi:hypothetical protein EON80_14165 [bacterium]|nr:MAG: hypothetical protein EON80_14165 [bacterium]